MKYQAVIFDFNGTLFWDTAYHNLAWDIFLKNHSISLTDDEKVHKIHGKPNTDILKSIFERELNPDEIKEMTLEKEHIYHKICLAQKMEYAPGAIKFIKFLKSNQIKYVIATSSGWENIEFYLKHMNLGKWIDTQNIIFENGSFFGKPDPDIFILSMEKLNVEPHEVAIFEDSPTGIMAAENAGAGKIIIVNSIGRDYSHLPYTCIKSFDEVDRGLFNAKPSSF